VHVQCAVAVEGGAEDLSSVRVVVGAVARQQHRAEVVLGVGQPWPGVHAAVHVQRDLEVMLGFVESAQCRGQHAQRAGGRAGRRLDGRDGVNRS
jgi:hypothetical protein